MDQTSTGLSDVGLSLRSLPCLYTGDVGLFQTPRREAWVLPCGRLLRAGVSDKYGNGAEEERVASVMSRSSRQPQTVVTIVADDNTRTTAKISFALLGKKDKDHHFSCECSLPKHGTSGGMKWMVELLHLLENSVVPILLCCDLVSSRLVDLAVLTLLKVLGAPDDVAAAAYLVRPSISVQDGNASHLANDHAQQALAIFREAGGVDEFLGSRSDLAAVRRVLQGGFAPANVAGTPEELRSTESAWLKDDIKLTYKLARQAEEKEKEKDKEKEEREGEDVVQIARVANFWYREVAVAAAQLADISQPSEAAPALFYRGTALARLAARGDVAEMAAMTEEARKVLELGAALAGGGRAKRAVAQQLAKELSMLPSPGEGASCIVEAHDAANAADPGQRLLVLDLGNSEANQANTVCVGSRPRGWQLLQAPLQFAWAIYAPPETLLAVSASPLPTESSAIQALGLVRVIQADAPSGKEQPLVEQVVEQVAQALLAREGCLLHCTDGGRASAVALACFICKYGLNSAEDWNADQAVAHTGEESAELAAGLRGVEIELAQVQFFEQSLWAEHIMGKIGNASASPDADEATPCKLLTTARVEKQPGDGNCLFHSLAFGLGDSASSLRKKIVAYMKENPELDISGTPLSEWVKMSAQTSVASYAQKMSRQGEWGGAPEIAVCAHMAGVCVNVYQPRGRDFELIAHFSGNAKDVRGRSISVLYVGRMHYDALGVD